MRPHSQKRLWKKKKKSAVNLLLRHEVKRCNLLLSFVCYRGWRSPHFFLGSLAFPATFLWLGAHLTPIKPSTCKSTDFSGVRWKVCFFSFLSPSPPPNLKSSLWERANCLNHSDDSDFKTAKTVVCLLTISRLQCETPGCRSLWLLVINVWKLHRGSSERELQPSWHPTGSDVANPPMPGRKWHNVERLGDLESHWTSADVDFNPEGKENRGLSC